MIRRSPTKKLLVATLGAGAVSYVVAATSSCGGGGHVTSGNLMGYDDAAFDDGGDGAPADALGDLGADISSSGNLMPPPADAGEAGRSGDASPDAGHGADASHKG